MKFVLGQVIERCEPDWYLFINDEALSNSDFLVDRCFIGSELFIHRHIALDINGPSKKLIAGLVLNLLLWLWEQQVRFLFVIV